MFFRPTTITSLSTAVLLLGLSSRVRSSDTMMTRTTTTVATTTTTMAKITMKIARLTPMRDPSKLLAMVSIRAMRDVPVSSLPPIAPNSRMPNDLQPPLTTEMCSIGYGRSSATMAICINESASFTCYGPASGKVECKGCFNPNQQNPNSAVTPNTPGSPNNGGNPNNAPPNSGSNSKGGSNSAPVDNKNGPNGRRSSGSRMRIDVLFLSLSTLVSAAFL
ncbi:hypothetical protein Pst134EA_031802 [Puccinia striiformis f. sp. tritici]|uniref:uncharacterized protein n=1 Tax=Puccinia striiformis f. sp. tritici TaxID=168172 RepID=UPI0020079D33|nr:uncharacterized protein Pst134EA_031802 [Puccinia striiformis f. sp. tritici]KAH9442580.1 hypothetical protein Pst134EA_031802 [Puccinia striiformis f. sp. tritici]